ncbi:MAG: reverse transcriptase domain-containing protein, partial [Cetobacterium sp.]
MFSTFSTLDTYKKYKKTHIYYENLANFRPISNLSFLNKLLERVVATQLISHLTENNLLEPLQSGFRKFHSTEIALVRVTNDLLTASDSGCLSVLILLDLSAAFDIVDHSVLSSRLETFFGVSDAVLNWFKCY